MKTNMPLTKPIRRFISETERILDTEITLLRKPEAPPGGTLLDVYTYNVDKNIILFPANYIGLLKDFVIAKQCTHLLIKGAAAKKSGYRILSYTPDSVYSGMRQVYLDALKDEAKKEKKLPVKKLIEMLFILYRQFHEDLNELPWNPIVNARIYHRMEQLRKTQLYILLKDGKQDMDEMTDMMDIVPRRYFVLDKSMFYARDLYLAKTLPSDKLMPGGQHPPDEKIRPSRSKRDAHDPLDAYGLVPVQGLWRCHAHDHGKAPVRGLERGVYPRILCQPLPGRGQPDKRAARLYDDEGLVYMGESPTPACRTGTGSHV